MPGVLRKSSKSKSPNKSKSPKTRKRVTHSDVHSIKEYSPFSPRVSLSPGYPKCSRDYTKSKYPCKVKYAVFDDMEEYRKYLLFIHERKLERDDYYNEIPNKYDELRQKGIPIGKSRKSRERR